VRLAVIDANIALSWVLVDEPSSTGALSLLNDFVAHKIELIAPSLWAYEVTNALRVSVLRDRISNEQGQRSLRALMKLGIQLYDFEDLLQSTWEFSATHALSIYDASYLALAFQQNCKVYSTDKQLMKAAQKSGLIHLPEEY
jgi:predicted nucleic acid-binding protein